MFKKIIRRSLYTLLALIGILLAIQIFAIVMVNPNAYKGVVQEQISKATGRDVTISGDFNYTLSLLPTISADAFSIKDQGGDDFVTVSDFSIRLALLPLFKGDISIEYIRLSGVRVLVDEESDLAFQPQHTEKPADQEEIGQASISIGDITLNNAAVSYYGQEYKIGQVMLENISLPFENTQSAKIILEDIRTKKSQMSGSLDMMVEEGGHYVINGILEASRLDLTDFMGDQANTPPKQPSSSTAAWLHNFDADITVKLGNVTYGQAPLGEVTMGAVVKDGKLTLNIHESNFGDGTLKGQVNLANEAKKKLPVSFAMKLDAQGMNYGRLSNEISGITILTGHADAHLDLVSVASSIGKIIENLDGTAEITTEKGRLDTGIVDLWASNLVTQMLPGLSHQTTVLNCGVARFDLDNGVARDEGILVDTARVTIGGKAVIDLVNKNIDMVLKPKSKDTSINIATAVRVYGDLSNPRVGPDVRDLASTIGTLALGAINPVALVVPFVDMGTGDENPCVAALKGQQQEQEGTTVEKVEEATRKAVDKVKGFMDKLF